MMRSITIHNLDDEINKKLDELAHKKKMSLNKLIKLLLRDALGLDKKSSDDRKRELSDFLGVWDKDDFESFNAATKDFEKINKDDWR